jgi:hypothetical protein
MRIGILVTGLFFLAGIIGMLSIDEEEGNGRRGRPRAIREPCR